MIYSILFERFSKRSVTFLTVLIGSSVIFSRARSLLSHFLACSFVDRSFLRVLVCGSFVFSRCSMQTLSIFGVFNTICYLFSPLEQPISSFFNRSSLSRASPTPSPHTRTPHSSSSFPHQREIRLAISSLLNRSSLSRASITPPPPHFLIRAR